MSAGGLFAAAKSNFNISLAAVLPFQSSKPKSTGGHSTAKATADNLGNFLRKVGLNEPKQYVYKQIFRIEL